MKIYVTQIHLDSSFQFHVNIFCFSLPEERYAGKKKQLVQDLILLPSIYMHMCNLYTYTNTYMPRFSPSGFFGLSKGLVPIPGITS